MALSPASKKIQPNSKFARALEDPNDPIIGVYKQSDIARELRRFKGQVATAAKALKISKKTLEKYILKSKVLKEIVTQVVEEEIDLVEDKLDEQIKKGNMTAILFYLKCKGRERGWIEKTDLSVDVKPITFKYTLAKGGQNAAKRQAKEKQQ